MVKTTANTSESKKASGVMTSASRSVTMKKTAVVDENKASSELVSMLRTYASRMHDTSIEADVFFKKLKTELETVLRSNKITPPRDIKIISTDGMIFGPPSPPKRQRAYGPEDFVSRDVPESALNIGILWKTKEIGEKDGKTQLSYSEFLKVEVTPSTRNVKFNRVVMNNEKTALNSMSRTDEVANIMLSMGM